MLNSILCSWFDIHFIGLYRILHAQDKTDDTTHSKINLVQKKSRTDTCVDVCCLTIVCNGRAMMRMEVACTARHKNDVYEIMFRLIETL